METESHFFYAIAIVLTALILTIGFGHCDQDAPAVTVYKTCTSRAKDVKDCKYPYPEEKPVK